MFGEKNTWDCTIYIGVKIITQTFLSCFFVFTSFIVMSIVNLLIQKCKSVEGD